MYSRALLHLLAAALAAAVVGLLVAFLSGSDSPRFSFIFFVYAYFFALLLGLPGYFVLRRLNRANWLTVAAVGFSVGLLVVGLFEFWNARIIKIEGLYAVPWLAGVANSAVFGFIGSIGALGFWFAVAARGAAEEAATRGRLLAVAVTLAVCAALFFVQPELTKDRSCHVRDFGPGPPHIASLRIDISSNEWPALLGLLDTFGRQHRLSRRSELWRPPQRWDRNLDFSLCRDGLGNIYGGDGTDAVYIHFKGPDQRALQKLYRELYGRITSKWRDRTTFVREGEPTARPSWLDETS